MKPLTTISFGKDEMGLFASISTYLTIAFPSDLGDLAPEQRTAEMEERRQATTRMFHALASDRSPKTAEYLTKALTAFQVLLERIEQESDAVYWRNTFKMVKPASDGALKTADGIPILMDPEAGVQALVEARGHQLIETRVAVEVLEAALMITMGKRPNYLVPVSVCQIEGDGEQVCAQVVPQGPDSMAERLDHWSETHEPEPPLWDDDVFMHPHFFDNPSRHVHGIGRHTH